MAEGKHKSKFIYVLLCAVTMLFVSACEFSVSEEDSDVVKIYYPDSDYEELEFEYWNNGNNPESLIQALNGKAQSAGLRSISNLGVKIDSIKVDENVVSVYFSESYRTLAPADRIIVNASVVKTLTQAEGIEGVRVYAGGTLYTDASGSPLPVLTNDSFLFEDKPGETKYIQMCIYYADETGAFLKPVIRDIAYQSGKSPEQLALEQLFADPGSSGLHSAVPAGTKLNSVKVSDGVCYVDMSREFLNPAGNCLPEVSVYSVVDTLVEINGIRRVQILIDGSEVNMKDNVDISGRLSRNLDLLEE